MIESGKILQQRYRVEKQIGQGGMGAVYLATDERFNSTVAIKETLLPDDNFLKAFKREARLLNSLKHSALPKVTDHFIEDNGQYIVMEYIPGDDLFEMMEKTDRPFPVADVIDWAEQLLRALEYLHNQENPVIHRDIKPQNLKLTKDGKIILLDFGLAKGNPTDANHQTAANSIFGYSRIYASLEQIQGTGTDPRSDLYSLAATLYHLATGKVPADALTRVMLVLNEEDDPLLPAHLTNKNVPEYFSAVLDRAMSLNANQRPQKAFEMREMISGQELTFSDSIIQTAPAPPVSTNLLNQNTKLISESKKSEKLQPSEIKTEILSDQQIVNASVETKIVQPATLFGNPEDTDGNAQIIPPEPQPFKAGRSARAFVLMGTLAIVGTAGTIVYFSDSTDSIDVPEVKTLFETSKPVVEKTDPEQSNPDVGMTNSNSGPAEDLVKDETSLPKETKPKESKKTEVAKSKENKPKVKSKNTTEENPFGDEFVFKNGKLVTPDGLTITRDGKIITKNGDVISDKGLKNNSTVYSRGRTPPPRLPRDPGFPRGFPIKPEEFEKLSPEQRKIVRRAIDKSRRDLMQEKANEKRLRDLEKKKNPPKPPPPENR